jgi:cytochrome P450
MTPLYLVLAVLLLSIASLLGWRYWQNRTRYQSLQSVPSPPRHWLLGNLPQVLAAVKQKQYFQLLFEWSQQYGPLYVYWIGVPVLVLSQPAAIENTIINGMRDGSLIRTPRTNQAWNDISGPILLGQSDSAWQWRRKAWNPEFSASGLSPYFDVVQQACAQVITRIETMGPAQAIPVDTVFVELTMRVIACLLLGIPVDDKTPSPEGPPLKIQTVYDAMAVLGYRFLRMATGEKAWMKYLPTPSSRDYWAARRDLESFLMPRIDLALALRDHPTTTADRVSPLFQASMLTRIAAKEPRYTREGLFSEAIELLIAGTDTTAHTLSFAMGELACHPEVLRQAQQVVDQVWQQHGAFSIESFKDLAYLQAIIKETLRLYSVASGSTSLQATRQTVIEGITLPQGGRVFWSILGAGRDATVYPHPEKFWPERWLESGKGSPPLPLINFGSGYHRCLGEHLAMLEATLMLAQLLHNFEWELVNGRPSLETLQHNLLLYPPDGMPLRFQARTAKGSAKR